MVDQLEITFGSPLRIVVEQPSSQPDIKGRLTITHNNLRFTGENVMYTLPVDHVISMEVSYIDAAGNPANVDGEVAWQCSDDALATLDLDPSDSSIVKVTPVGAAGQIQVTATADADLGAGVRNIITVCDIELVAGEAVAGTIQPLGEPQPIAPTATPVKKK